MGHPDENIDVITSSEEPITCESLVDILQSNQGLRLRAYGILNGSTSSNVSFSNPPSVDQIVEMYQAAGEEERLLVFKRLFQDA